MHMTYYSTYSAIYFYLFYTQGYNFYMFFFFFQAEDGIRDKLVTGVQTCALPISKSPTPSSHGKQRAGHCCRYCYTPTSSLGCKAARPSTCASPWADPKRARNRSASTTTRRTSRSEERRVGKECRARWSRDQ